MEAGAVFPGQRQLLLHGLDAVVDKKGVRPNPTGD
jgi:hypothetical protein